ncbi:MAG: hypothetical protein IJT77_09820 [Clostridia bacterium]|nr:hypothetical protein [Clostridia bacterium]
MSTPISQDQRKAVRQYYADTIARLKQTIKTDIERIGGEDMLTQRVDILEWTMSAEEDLKMFEEVIRLLDGANNVDGNLISAAIVEKRHNCQHDREEIEKLKEEILRQEQALADTQKQLEMDKDALDVLTAVFAPH